MSLKDEMVFRYKQRVGGVSKNRRPEKKHCSNIAMDRKQSN